MTTPYGGAELAAAFRTVRKNTLQVAEDIPEDKYGFAPAPGTRTVAELLAHVAGVHAFTDQAHRVKKLTTLQGFDFPAFHATRAAESAKLTTKPAILAALRASDESFGAWLASLSDAFLAERVTNFDGQGTKSRLELIMAVKEHEMHHRGQLMVMQRMLGITPHLTREREARMAGAARGR
jgi:uncharacterized damage-inducible protein DinB